MAALMKVRVRAFAAVREALGTGETEVSVAPGTDVAGLLAGLAAAYPNARLGERRVAVAVNRAYAPPDLLLADGDEVALIPPVSGGSPKLFEVTDRPLSLDDVAGRVRCARVWWNNRVRRHGARAHGQCADRLPGV